MTLSALADAPPGLIVPPRYATARDPSRRTLGPAVGKVAELLGTPLMPWQRLVADVTGEVDDAGRPTRPFNVITVPRQAGKTTLDLALSVQRCLYRPNSRVWHTAQTGQDARLKWAELVDAVLASPLREAVKGRPRRTNGAESLEFLNGSKLRPHPPTRDSLHGQQSDTNNVDEAWALDEAHGADLLQAITPTQLTRPGAQTFIWSTMGDAGSTWFHGLVERARSGGHGLSLFDWGIPDDVDPSDVDAVAAYHPARGYTVTVDSLRAAQVSMADKPGEYARAYGNRRTGTGERVIPADAWDRARSLEDLPAGRPAYGVAVAGDGSAAAVVAAVADPTGRPVLEVLAHRPGRSWVAEYVLSLRDAGQGVAVLRGGPSAPIADALELAKVELLQPTTTDYAGACQDLWDRLCDDAAADDGPRLLHRDHPALDAAVDVAGRRSLQDGGWVWNNSNSTGDISALAAGTLAAWAVARAPAPSVLRRSVFVSS